MRVVVLCREPEPRLVLVDALEPQMSEGSLLVDVVATSMNHGEVKGAFSAGAAGDRIGWDFAGVVAASASPDFSPGDRVAGLCPGGAWAERIAPPAYLCVRLPDSISWEAAACLPTAGLTAALALQKGGELKNKRVLVTGATGGVGAVALQLAAAAGAHVTALARNEVHRDLLMRLGASEVGSAAAIEATSPAFDVIVDAVGGDVLGQCLGWLASRGLCVVCGDAGGRMTTFDSLRFRTRPGGFYGGTQIYGFFLGEELLHTPPGPLLLELAIQVASGKLDPVIGAVADWTSMQDAADDLLARRIVGKSVLRVRRDGAVN